MPTAPPTITTQASSWGGIASWGTALVGVTAFLSGLSCALSAYSNGTLATDWTHCLALIGVGTATTAPGVQAMKVGLFARPPAQQTGPVGEKR